MELSAILGEVTARLSIIAFFTGVNVKGAEFVGPSNITVILKSTLVIRFPNVPFFGKNMNCDL
jgi:hypothetical protein